MITCISYYSCVQLETTLNNIPQKLTKSYPVICKEQDSSTITTTTHMSNATRNLIPSIPSRLGIKYGIMSVQTSHTRPYP